MKKFFAFILGLTALMLALTAASYSVYGLSKLFAGASVAIIILTSILEFSKIIVVSFLHQFWKKIHWTMRSYLSIAVLFLMLITSAGIYGFMSNAYSITSTELEKNNGQIKIYDKKINIFQETKKTIEQQLILKNQRISSLTDLRKSQETRLDSLYKKGWYRSARKTEQLIKEADENIKELSKEVTEINQNIQSFNDSISSYEMKKLDISNNNISGEVGPLKYVASMLHKDIDNVANWLMLLFIFLIDPLSIFLVLSTNKIISLIIEEKKIKHEKQPVIKQKDVNTQKQPNNKIIQYESNEKGDFEKKETVKEKKIFKIEEDKIERGIFTAETPTNIVITEEDKKNKYIYLLNKFYKNGKATKGETVPSFKEFQQILASDNNIDKHNIQENTIKDFLVICGLLNIIQYNDKSGVYNKSFNEAKELILKMQE